MQNPYEIDFINSNIYSNLNIKSQNNHKYKNISDIINKSSNIFSNKNSIKLLSNKRYKFNLVNKKRKFSEI